MRCQITLNTTLSICSCLNADLNRWSFVLCRQRGLQGKTVLTASLLPAERGTDTICPRAAAAAALPALFLFRLGLKIISRLGSMWACMHMFLLTLRASNGKLIAARVPKVIEKSLRVRGRKIMNEDPRAWTVVPHSGWKTSGSAALFDSEAACRVSSWSMLVKQFESQVKVINTSYTTQIWSFEVYSIKVSLLRASVDLLDDKLLPEPNDL